MLVKISSEMLAAIGGNNPAEFLSNLTTFIAKAKENETFMAESKVTLEALQESIADLEAKIGTPLTEARVKEIVGAEVTPAIASWAGSEAGKKIIGGEASRIVMEASAATGTIPAKPAPAGAQDNVANVKALLEQGKFEDAYALDKDLQAEFPDAKNFAAYAKAQAAGRITINKSK